MGPGEGTFEAMEAALKSAVATLRDAGIEFLLAGTLASWARGGPGTEHDLDLILRPDDAERALQALADAGMRTERPPEGWLFKAWHDDTLIDLIFAPTGLEVDDELFARGETIEVLSISVRVLALEDLLTTKLMTLDEHSLDYRTQLQIARALRERIDWGDVRERTSESPYARAFFCLLDELGIPATAGSARPAERHVRVLDEQGRTASGRSRSGG